MAAMQELQNNQPKDGLEGFDPLAEGVNFGGSDKSIFEEATQRVVQNILKSYTSTPQSEQDVIAIFHELVGMQVVRGVRFLGTNQQTRYDGCYVCRYDNNQLHGYNADINPLGINPKIIATRETRPLVLEYKLDLDGLISDFAKELKFQNEIHTIICWGIGDLYNERYALRSYLVGEEGASRQFFGATHSLWYEKAKLADIVCLQDLIRFFSDPETVRAEHKTRLKD
jgi:hypothetical protein